MSALGFKRVWFMYLQWQGYLSTGQEALDVDLRDATIATIGNSTYLYTSTGVNGGVAVYELSTQGTTAQLVDQQFFTGQTSAVAGGVVEVVEMGGQTHLVFGSAPGDGLIGYSLSGQGNIGGVTSLVPTTGATGQMSAMAVANTGGGTLIYTIDAGTGTLMMHSLPQSGGQIGATPDGAGAPVAQSTAITFSANTQIETVSVGGTSFLLAADQQSDTITSYQISSSTGALTQTGSTGAAMGLGVNAPTALETVSAFGENWVVLGSAGSSSISVMRLEADGGLTPVDHIIDTLSTRFAGVTTLAVAQEGDRVFVIAGGSDDGVSVFTLAPDGRLLHLQTIPHTTGAGLENVNQLTASVTGNHIQVFASSGSAPGLTQFNIDLSQVDAPILAENGAQVLSGGAGQDMLVGSDIGADTLSGGAGDDILISGAAGGQMTGGGGLDRFVIHANAALTVITDFTPGVDQLDMSDFPMLRWVGQLTIQPTAWGARITFRDATIDVYAAGGGPMDASDLFAGGLIGPDRVLVLLPDAGDVIMGTDGNNTLEGTENNDTIQGLDGRDTITGEDGNDLVEGGDDHDVIFGGNGDDTLDGGAGNDQVWGGAGDDLVIGGVGNDTLGGSKGNDTIEAGGGNDEAWASADNDLVYGGNGRDTLGGGTGNDTVFGENGDDVLWGGRGNDQVWGGNGDDVVGGGPGQDQLYGEGDNDTMWANGGNDTLWGGSGDDLMGAGEGNDLVYGEAGNDELRLGQGNDTGYGGNGADTLFGVNGNDALFGGAGDDVLDGGNGSDVLAGEDDNDVLLGGGGRDTLGGGAGNDTLWAGADDDEIVGGTGNDVLIGEGGADSFVFYASQGTDVIRDFTLNEDSIVIGSGANSFGDLSMSQQGNDVLITLGTGTIRLEDVNIGALDAGDFVFL